MKINDTVKIIAGDNKGKEAKIVRIDTKNHRAMLEGIGIVERHLKKSYVNPNGGKKTIHAGIEMSNLKLVKAAEYKKAEKPAKKTAVKADAKKAKKGAK